MTPTEDRSATAADLDRVVARLRRTVGWALSVVGVCLVVGVVVGVAVAAFADAALDASASGTVGLLVGVVAAGVSLVVASAFVPSD